MKRLALVKGALLGLALLSGEAKLGEGRAVWVGPEVLILHILALVRGSAEMLGGLRPS